MSKTNALASHVEVPDLEDTKQLNENINRILESYDGRTRTLWLFMLATQYYVELEDETEFDLMDYQMTAEECIRQTDLGATGDVAED